MKRKSSNTKAIAFHLPQFHPIRENDLWWGKGFTEWANVTKAHPLFPGHYQPQLPADLGFYDLRCPEARQRQADLAREYGIHGFCYFHYWLHGKRLLQFPVDEILRTGEPQFPFCLCWANHNWTRNWDDGNRELLIEQRYSMQDHWEHIHWLAKVFLDERYIRIDGKPLFLIFRASMIPHIKAVTELWRHQARKLGVGELFLAEVESQTISERVDPRNKGLDAVVEFQPDFHLLLTHQARCVASNIRSLATGHTTGGVPHYVFDYAEMVELMREKTRPPYPMFRCVTPSWDNTARKNREGVILHNSSPELYGQWLAEVLEEERTLADGERITFLNAWNEWAEGNHLEPCRRWGRAYLETTRDVFQGNFENHLKENLFRQEVRNERLLEVDY